MRATSRYRFSTVEKDSAGRVYLGPRPHFGFRELADTVEYVVSEGDTLYAIAAATYRGFARPEQFWWAIADFQPEPIRDITVPLEAGRRLYIPSLRTLEEQILATGRSVFDEEVLDG
jgi:Tfp pilus assembly protein FimV